MQLNQQAWAIAETLIADAQSMGVQCHTNDSGVRIVDCGVKQTGSIAAGLQLTQAAMAGLGQAWIEPVAAGRSSKQSTAGGVLGQSVRRLEGERSGLLCHGQRPDPCRHWT